MPIKKPHLRPTPGVIANRARTDLPNKRPSVLVSFRLLDLQSNAKFSTVHCEDGYIAKLLERLRDLNQTLLADFMQPGNALRSHKIDFSKTTEPNGFVHLNEQLESEPWQFQISSNEHGRLHGFLLQDTFYIVWIDPCHLLYSKGDWCDRHKQP